MKKLFSVFTLLLASAPLVSAQSFYDSFSRGADPGPLTPWTSHAGNWSVTGGLMRSGLNTPFTYANAYITNVFTNYTVQGRFSFPVGAYGGGIGGRLNPITGTHYAAWMYPENSAGGSNVLRLVKFTDWSTFGYLGVNGSVMQTVNLSAVGTNSHILRMDFQTNRITVFLDGAQMINMNDAETPYYTNGAVTLDMWTDAGAYNLVVDDVVVNNLGLSASPETYTNVSGLTLSVAAPGVLANDTGGLGPLNSSLVSGPARGILTLSSNGGFNYTATNGFTGTDTFTYRANDGSGNSSATVTLTVRPNTAPVANGDFYSAVANTTLNVAAPGVLANDTDADGNTLTAQLVNGVLFGTLTLNTNGGFTYQPPAGFTGSDSFTYRASDGISNSAPVTVNISVSPPALLADDFSRGTDPGPLTPWIAQSGNWTVTGGQLRGTNGQFSYGYCIETNYVFTNFMVQARLQFPTNGFGGGLGGCLNPLTGARYTAWIYPDNSLGGSNVVKLFKFNDYLNFSYNGVPNLPMQQVNVASVGTNFHTLKLGFFGPQVAVYYDGTQVMSVTDVEAQPYTNGAVSFDFWTDANIYRFTADDLLVNPLVANDNYTLGQNTPLTVAAPGVLGNDTRVYAGPLTATLQTPTSHGTVILNTNGGFTYTPGTNYVGADSFTYTTTDGTNVLGTATANLTVILVNTAPTFGTVSNSYTLVELSSLTVTNKATDTDLPANTLTYSLLISPTGATIDTNGVITWTPTEAQGPSTNTITTRVVDNGVPPLSATNSFAVIVLESNSPPVLTTLTNRTVNELTTMTVNNGATDSDLPANTLTYSLLVAPANATISAAGVITWTPTEGQGPSTNTFTTRVVDNGNPALSATNSFIVTVNEVNSTPVLPAIANRTIPALTTLTVTNTATDSDLPANNLVYSLLTAPTGAGISADGVISWTPTSGQNNSTNLFRTRVIDDGSPALSVTNTFTVFVNSNPVVVLDSTALVLEGCTPTNNAIDPGETVTLAVSLKNLGTGPTANLLVTLYESNGVAAASGPVSYGVIPVGSSSVQTFTFSAIGSCGGSVVPTFQFQDGSSNLGAASNSYAFGQTLTNLSQDFDTVTAPALPSGWTNAITGSAAAWVTTTTTPDSSPNAVFSADAAATGVNTLTTPISAPLGGSAQLSFRNSYSLEYNVSNPTNGYDGGVLEIKIGTNDFVDILASGATFVSGGYTRTISASFSNPLGGRQAWSGNSGGYTNTVINLPIAALGQPVQFRFRCGTDTDNNSGGGTGWRIDGLALVSRNCCNNTAPVLASQSDRAIAELTTLTVTNAATDSSTAPSGLTYSLVSPPPGASINANGIITWSPTEAQGPSTNTITTIVSDNSFPPLSATNSFQVVVLDVNSAPTLPSLSDLSVLGGTSITVTNTAIDTDLPLNALSYLLLTAPAGAVIDTNGVISWAAPPGASTNLFRAVVTDDGTPPLSATNSFTVYVTVTNTAPSLPAQTNQTIVELTLLTVTNTAFDGDVPANLLSYQLLNPPTGAAIDTNGIITWTPSEVQGPGTNTITTRVTDNGVPPLSATNSFSVVVTEANTAPVLPLQTNRFVTELGLLSITNAASDSDIPTNNLSYQLLNPPAGAAIDTNGVITWTPTEAEGPGTHTIITVVTDNGVPPLSATNSFDVVVTEVNTAPQLPLQTNHTIAELSLLTVTNTATDSDLPTNGLTYQLLNAPTGALIDTNGVITWTPTEAEGPGTHTIITVVTDNGVPPLSATNSFDVVVTEINTAPQLPLQTNHTIAELSLLTVTNTATDSDLPTNGLTYQLLNAPTGALIDTNGVITWTPTEAEGPGTHTIITVVTDNGVPPLSATNSFDVVVTEINTAPQLPLQTNHTIVELSLLTVTNTATDPDLPTNGLTYQLLNAPTGALIDTNGVITWTPTEAEGPGTHTIITVVTDNGVPPLSATNSFEVVVTEVNTAPQLSPQPDRTLAASTLLIVTNSATDSDLPANTLAYSLVTAPDGAAIDTNGVITWTSGTQSGTNRFETVVTDNGLPPLSTTNRFEVVVTGGTEVVPAPVIQSINLTPDGVVLTWSAVSNHVYQLQHQDTIGDTNWTTVVPDFTASAATITATNAVGTIDSRFYRVKLVQ